MLEGTEWEKVERDLWEITYQSDSGHFLYVEDSYRNGHPYNQTEIEDWHEKRYKIKIREPFKPETHEEVIREVDSLDDAELYLDIVTSELESGRSPDF